MSVLQDFSNEMAAAVEKAGAYTVMVNARRRLPASGVAFDKEHILTADHVVERDEDISVLLPDGAEVSASVAGRDPGSDLALLKLEKAAATPAETNGEPRIGALALAVGRPSGEGMQASLGIVSAVGGPTRTRRGGMLEGYIRTDAIPYPGFSGGALIDAAGKVLGINTSGLGHGNSVAIPAAIAWKIAGELKTHGSVKRGYLGVRSQLVELPNKAAEKLNREQSIGLLVVGVEEDSPAQEAGLMVGDIIVALNGETVTHHDELLGMLSGSIVGTNVSLQALRGGEAHELKVTIAEREAQNEHRHQEFGFRGIPRGKGPRGRRGGRRG
jgi:S1-C subfamily serine protease